METKIVTLIIDSLPLLMRGLAMTLKLWIFALMIGLVFGFIFGILTCKRLRVPFLSTLIEFATFILRAVPFYVQLLIFYFVLPDLIHVNLSGEIAAILCLGLCSSGYVCQIVRAGINSINYGQWEAALVLGFNYTSILRFIIMPQMLRNVLPAFVNEFDHLIKATSIISAIGVIELTRSGMNIVSRGADAMVIYMLIAGFYLIISAIFNFIGKKIELKLDYN